MGTPSKKAPQCCNKCCPGRTTWPETLKVTLTADCLPQPLTGTLDFGGDPDCISYEGLTDDPCNLFVELWCEDGQWFIDVYGS